MITEGLAFTKTLLVTTERKLPGEFDRDGRDDVRDSTPGPPCADVRGGDLQVQEQHHNQRAYTGAGAGTAGGWHGGIVFRRGFLFNFCLAGGF